MRWTPCTRPVSTRPRSIHSPWKAIVHPARKESCRVRGRRRPIPTGNPCSRSATRIPSRMVVAFPLFARGFFLTPNRPGRRLPPVHNSAGNQTGSPRSVLLIGTVPLAVERAGTTADLPCETVVPAHQSMVFPLTSPTTFVPTQPFTASGFLCADVLRRMPPMAGASAGHLAHGGGNAQPIALRMAAISAR